MTTIYSVHQDGRVIGRCDSKCHNATGEVCRCCCGGGHHGIGSKAAIEDRNLLTDEDLITECKIIFGPGRYRIGRMPKQMELFS